MPGFFWSVRTATTTHEPDVYTALYQLVGVEPQDQAKRTKPSCCDGDGTAPEVELADVDVLVSRAKSLGRRTRGA